MKLPKIICYFIITFCLLACSQSETKTTLINKKLKIHFEDTHNLKKFKAIILIPREGCGGCISEATMITKELLGNRRDIGLIFTDVTDMKLLKLQYGNNLLKDQNVSVDITNLFVDKRISSIYPQIFYLKNGKCVFSELFNTTSERFKQL